MNYDNPAQTLLEAIGAIFYALISLHGGNAEIEAADFIREALSSGTIRDSNAKTILSGIVRMADAGLKPTPPRYVVEHGNVLRLIKA
jgi:hypothetical protein